MITFRHLVESIEGTLGSHISISIGNPNADFWLWRRHDEKVVGKPTRTFNPEHYGIKVTDPQLDPDFLFSVLDYIHQTGYFRRYAHGTLKLVNIRIGDVKGIPMAMILTAEPRMIVHAFNKYKAAVVATAAKRKEEEALLAAAKKHLDNWNKKKGE